MIQKKWFRIETDASGAILSCEEVNSKGRQGATVRYYEALTKAAACSQASKWAAKHREVRNNANRERAERLRSAGLCVTCGRSPRGNASRCDRCREEYNARVRQLRTGAAPKISKLSDLALRESTRESAASKNRSMRAKWGRVGADYYLVLKRFDAIGPEAFRVDLCQRIIKAGGGEALDEYERNRNRRSIAASLAEGWAAAIEALDSAAE